MYSLALLLDRDERAEASVRSVHRMHFRMYSKVTQLVIVPECDIPVNVNGSSGVVLIRSRSPEGRQRDPSDTDTEGPIETIAVTGFEHDVPQDLVDMLTSLTEERIPDGYSYPTHWMTYTDGPAFHNQGFLIEGSMPALRWFPNEMQNFIEDLEKAAGGAARRVVDLIRWREGKLSGSPNPLTFQLFQWSVDGTRWFNVPCDADIYEDERLGTILTPNVIADVQEMAIAEDDIPFAHVLLREAWDLRITNPRSSINFGVASAEIGLKQAIKTLVPGAGYLVEKLLLPPLDDLLTNYVPKLPVSLKFDDAPPSIPHWVRKAVKDGLEARNKLAHRPLGGTEVTEELKFENLTRLLVAVHDLLLLLDFYCGKEWSEEFLSDESRKYLKLPPRPPEHSTFPAQYASNRKSFSIFIPEPDVE
jgi:hypothetical protein